ncbi:TPA: mannosylglycerate hydrolase [Clostridioides difficile]|uniref:mannosylglycerate hydrolase n=1 Tax=Clostridioides difficile TaxID=1496 RepID=UPI0009401C74|nr:mannosylglycerate hydrolase [Clostridioides difficile]EJX2685602.1 mannosylglycerate hydrolase [Clostridioides difficile]MBY2263466.1 mannosylglycerate hydrolase [Clostridioides difficile]MCG7744437.1 mannosylglycerate hydrolase [Clostridioides difficile]MDN9038248.1 mannosylglycerate hydrolase [Clostridioides difficile]MDN9100658.1 mannosylglycerate hydrolase [Clostridioides difficile]
MKKNVHIVPHMHWDREWYFSTEESRILLVNNMEEIMDMLENNHNYPYYVMDGQTAILEDYLAVKPECKERIKKLVQEGRLIIGPWYTQTDEMVVGGESILRNLLYGIKDCDEFGEYMKIGYLPDSFGQSAQMPQILNGFDIKYSMFWRGCSERKGTNKTEFNWKSDDGSSVLVQILPLGYAIGKYLPMNEDELRTRMDKYLPVLDKGATTDHIILPNGHDQMPIQKNIFEVIYKLKECYPERKFFLSRYENIFKELEKNEDIDTIKGEFLDGKYMRVHRSIFSTRMDIKSANARIESKITNILEPLASIAYFLGFEYHHGLIELIWKEIMKNHAHDSIGCCCSDKVHHEIMNRFFLAEEKVDQLITFYKRRIVDAMSCEMALDKLVAFNLMPYDRNEIVNAQVITKMKAFEIFDKDNNKLDFEVVHKEVIDAGLIDRQIVHYGNYDSFMVYTINFKDKIPAMGYKAYMIKEIGHMLEKAYEVCDMVDNDFYTIQVNENGTLKIFDKKLNKTFENVLLMENGGDEGDEYDFSPLPNEKLIFNDNIVANSTIKKNRFNNEIKINYRLKVPKDIQARKNNRADSFIDFDIVINVPNDKAIIDVVFNINNQARDCRVRTYIPTNIASKFSVSDNQFGHIKRSVYDDAMEVWQQEEWSERPDSIYPMLTFVGLSDKEHGVAVLTNSTREFEIVGEKFDTIAITLFRSVGFLGKEEMARRPGRPSGIKLPTPDSQMIGDIKIDLAIVTHEKSTLEANVANMAKEYLTKIQTYNKMPYNAMKLNQSEIEVDYSYSLLKETNKDLVLSVVKKAEKQEALVVRFYNSKEETKSANIVFNKNIKTAKWINLNEKELESISIDNNFVNVECLMNQVKTILVK